MPWQLFDYIDERGRNAYTDWREAQDGRTQGRADNRLITVRNAGDRLPNSVTPTSELGVSEIELNGRSGAFRIFMCRTGNRGVELTLLGGGREKDTKYIRKEPHIDPAQAGQRRSNLLVNVDARRVVHEFEEDNLGSL